MSGENVLRQSEMAALKGSGYTVNVTGKKKRGKAKILSLGATGFLTIMIAVAAILFSSGNIMPAAISQRLLEETDVQYADLVETKKIVLQQALRDGELPDDTAEKMKNKGYVVGYIDENGQFIEDNKAGRPLVIKHDEEIITADNFVQRMSVDPGLYAAVQEATYDRAAAYYDEAAVEVMNRIGTKRNNFSKNESFEDTMRRVMGSGSSVEVNNAQVTTKTETDQDSNTTTTYQVSAAGEDASATGDVGKFIEEVRQKNPAATAEESAVNTADALKVADQISQEQRSSLFYALMMENISKMKAGDGNDSQINDTMNYLTRQETVEVVDTKTGEKVKVSGSVLEAPSLVAILTGQKVDQEKVRNFTAERVLETIRNRAGNSGYSAVDGTVASAEDKVKGSIGRLIGTGTVLADTEAVQSVEPTLKSSLVDNGFDSLKGVAAGEYLASGAVNLGRMLARQSGATPGDMEAVQAYARVNQAVLAMEAKVDRMMRSPLDVTSKNTFLGSIMYNVAMAQVENPELRNLGSLLRNFSSVMGTAVRGLLPASFADATESYMTDLGECETAGNVGAAATASCWEIAVFDTTTLDDPYNDPEFQKFVEENTELDASGERKIIAGSTLANFLTYLVERKTPIGVMDGGILEAINEGKDKIPFLSDILAMLANFLGADEKEKQMGSGREYVNAADNQAWDENKYAQRYVAMARVVAMLKEHSADKTAYQQMKYFEGEENPVVAFLQQYRAEMVGSK